MSTFEEAGGNNALAQNRTANPAFDDPVAIELDRITGPIYVAGLEFQDNFPTRVLTTSTRKITSKNARVTMYGNDHLFAGPPDQRSIDVQWTVTPSSTPKLTLYGSVLNYVEVDDVLKPIGKISKIFARNGSRILSLGALADLTDPAELPWEVVGRGSVIESLGMRAIIRTPGLDWTENVRNIPYTLRVGK